MFKRSNILGKSYQIHPFPDNNTIIISRQIFINNISTKIRAYLKFKEKLLSELSIYMDKKTVTSINFTNSQIKFETILKKPEIIPEINELLNLTTELYHPKPIAKQR